MALFFSTMIHHKGNWLFTRSDDKIGAIKQLLDNDIAIENTVEQYLTDHCRAKKFDLAFVDTVFIGNDRLYLYLADISAFSDGVPDFLLPFTAATLPQMTKEESGLFERTMAFIAACRRATASLLGQEVTIVMDRPVGTHHPKHPEIVYPINYGYVDGMLSADGEGIDVYLLGIHEPLVSCRAKIIALVRREDDIEDKLAAAPLGMDFSEEEIARQIRFQEQFYRSSVHKSL